MYPNEPILTINSCVAEDIKAGKDETIDELCNVLQKLNGRIVTLNLTNRPIK